VAGEPVKDDAIVRLANASCRVLLALIKARKGKPKNAVPSIEEHFRRKRAQQAAS
jgi:hypothetical protein